MTAGVGVFRLISPETVRVEAHPKPPGGAEARIGLTLRYLTMTERRALLERLREGNMTDAELAGELALDWDGVADEEGEPIGFSADALAAAMDIPYMHDAVRDAISEELLGRALEKNSVRPVGAGPPASAP